MKYMKEHLAGKCNKFGMTMITLFMISIVYSSVIFAAHPDIDYISKELNMDFEFSSSFWDLGRPTNGDYFGGFKEITFDFFASNEECTIDVFMIMERNKKGSLVHYTTSEKQSYIDNGINASHSYEGWGGRVVGYVTAKGRGEKIWIMKSRVSSMGSEMYINKTYSIKNNKNLVTMVISAPAASWGDSSCSAGIKNMLNSFKLNGEPDPRESWIANKEGIDLRGNGARGSTGITSNYDKETYRTSRNSTRKMATQLNDVRNLLIDANDYIDNEESSDAQVSIDDALDILDEIIGDD